MLVLLVLLVGVGRASVVSCHLISPETACASRDVALLFAEVRQAGATQLKHTSMLVTTCYRLCVPNMYHPDHYTCGPARCETVGRCLEVVIVIRSRSGLLALGAEMTAGENSERSKGKQCQQY